MKAGYHFTGLPWNEQSMLHVKRVRPPSEEAKKDGSPDGLVFVLSVPKEWSTDGASDTMEDKLVLRPESVDEVNHLIRALGELKSRMLKKEAKKHTVFE